MRGDKMIDVGNLEKIIQQTVEAVEKGKYQIYEIAENARQERDRVKAEVEDLRKQSLETIQRVDELEKKEKQARRHLMKVSKNYEHYGEKDMQEAYEKARRFQMELGLMRERETQLRLRRDQLEFSLRKLNDTVQKAEGLMTQVGVALKFLTENLEDISGQLEELQQRQHFGLRIIKAQEEERKRVAREIHDGPAQTLANLVLRVEICEKLLASQPSTVGKELKELKELIKTSLRDIRKIIFDLRPMVLDDLGIVPALQRYLADFEDKFGLSVEFIYIGKEVRLKKGIEVTLFRILQEALNNVYKHAGVMQATVKLEITEKQVNLSIIDIGRGFDVEKVLKGEGLESYGVIGMRERVDLLEGKFYIKSAPGRGTEIRIKIPLRNIDKVEELAD